MSQDQQLWPPLCWPIQPPNPADAVSPHTYWGMWLDHWQPLIAGSLAILAAIVAVWGTLRAAKLQVKGTHEAADKQIDELRRATARQVNAVHSQIEASDRAERLKLARDNISFAEAMVGSMDAVLENVTVARARFGNNSDSSPKSPAVYVARQSISGSAFPDLRAGCLRNAAFLTANFLRLEGAVVSFATDWSVDPGVMGGNFRIGNPTGFLSQLENIEKLAVKIREDAGEMAARWHDRLENDPG